MSELSCSYLTSNSVLDDFIIPADWVRLSLSMTRFFVPVSLLDLSLSIDVRCVCECEREGVRV